MKTPIKIRYILLILLSVGSLVFWSQFSYQHPVAILQQASAESNFANTFTGSYLAGYMASKKGDWQEAAELFEESRKLAPQNTALLENTYIFKLLYGEVKDALVLARQHPDNESASSVSVILRAMDAVQSKKYQRADQLITQIMPGTAEEMSVGTVMAPFFLAWTKIGEGKVEEGLSIMKDLKERNIAGEIASYHLALMYETLGRNEEAEASYKTALSGEVKPYHFVLAAGNFYLRQGKLEHAKAVFEYYLKTSPYSELFSKELESINHKNLAYPGKKPDIIDGWVEVLMEGVRIAYQSNLNDEGTAYLQLVNYLKPEFPQSLMLLASHYEGREEYVEANRYYKRIPVDSSFYWESKVDSARNEYKLGNKKAAEKMLRELAEEKPNNYIAPLELAELLREDERYDVAANVYEQVVMRIPEPALQHWYIFYAKGVCYEQSNQWDKAEASFLKALELNPDQPDVLNYLGYSWLMQGKSPEKAQQMIETAIAARPDDAHIMDSMGWVLYKTGKYEKAVDYLEQAIETMPYDATVNDHLGDLYWRLGRVKEARYQWQRVLEASPKPDAELIRQVNEKLRGGLSEITSTPGTPDVNKQLSTNEYIQ